MKDEPLPDSGERIEFEGGAVRDTEKGKPRYDLIPERPLERVAHHYRRGAEKYDERNWEKGIPPERLYSSALRHLHKWRLANLNSEAVNEDHLAAVIFNVMGLMYFEEKTPVQSEFYWANPTGKAPIKMSGRPL